MNDGNNLAVTAKLLGPHARGAGSNPGRGAKFSPSQTTLMKTAIVNLLTQQKAKPNSLLWFYLYFMYAGILYGMCYATHTWTIKESGIGCSD